MPLDQASKAKIGKFLVELLKGSADLGFAAFPLLELYSKAKSEKLNFMDMVASNPEAAEAFLQALRRQASKLSPTTLLLIEGIAADARKAQNLQR